MIQVKAQAAGNGSALSKVCNAGLDHLGRSLRASRKAPARGVATLGKGAPLPASRVLRSSAFRLAESINSIGLEY